MSFSSNIITALQQLIKRAPLTMNSTSNGFARNYLQILLWFKDTSDIDFMGNLIEALIELLDLPCITENNQTPSHVLMQCLNEVIEWTLKVLISDTDVARRAAYFWQSLTLQAKDNEQGKRILICNQIVEQNLIRLALFFHFCALSLFHLSIFFHLLLLF